MSDFGHATYPLARKDYRCSWCGQRIPKGERHLKYAGIFEGDWQDWRMHDECYDVYMKADEVGFCPFENERPPKHDECTCLKIPLGIHLSDCPASDYQKAIRGTPDFLSGAVLAKDRDERCSACRRNAVHGYDQHRKSVTSYRKPR